MGLFDFLKPKQSNESLLVELIDHNATHIAATEGKSNVEATYLSICVLFDDIQRRHNGPKGYKSMMGLLQTKYAEHFPDVVTYIAWSTGKLELSAEAEAALVARHK